MSVNYAKKLPRDGGNDVMQEYPAPILALTRYNRDNSSASSVMTMNDNTTVLEVTTNGGPAALKWISSTDTTASVISAGTTANYDHVIATANTRRFVVPVERQGTSSIVGLNKQNGLYNRYALISTGPVSSVFAAEF